MLNIVSINPTGMFSFGEVSTYKFPETGLIHLRGLNADKGASSNGAGKSSLFNALCEILYGDNPTGASGEAVVNNVWQSGFCGRVEFATEKGFFRVTSCRSWKGDLYPADNNNKTKYTGTGLFFDEFVNGGESNGWMDCRGASSKETRQEIVAALGLTYRRFLSVAYMSPREGVLFLSGSNRDREDLLVGITGAEAWDAALSRCRQIVKASESERSTLGIQAANLQGQLVEIQQRIKDLSRFDCAKEIAEATEKISALSEIISFLQSDRVLCANTAAELSAETRTPVKSEPSEKQKKLEAEFRALASKRIEADVSLDENVTAWQDVRSVLSNLLGEFRALGGEDRIAEIAELVYCPVCESKIPKNKKAEMQKRLVELKKEIEEKTAAAKALEEKVSESRVSAVVEQEKQETARREKMQKIQAELTVLQQAQREANEAVMRKRAEVTAKWQAEIQKINEIDLQIQKNEQDIRFEQLRISKAEEILENLKRFKERESELLTQHANIAERLAVLNDEAETHKWLIHHIPYIKLHKLSTSIERLSDLVNKNLSESGSSLNVTISSFSDKKSVKYAADTSDMLKSEIKIEVSDGKKDIDYRLYSEGERATLAIAITKALHDLAVDFGQGCNVQMLDEVFSFLDHENSQKLAESFGRSRSGITLLTDNSGRASGLLTFDYLLTVTKRNGLTTLEANRG